MNKQKKILFFVNGTVPSKKAFEEARKLVGNVCFRNAEMDVEGTYIEDADDVAGAVPERYRIKYGKELPAEKKKEPNLKAVADWKPNK